MINTKTACMKTKKSKICLKNYFGQLLLVFAMLLVGVSITNTSANAADGETIYGSHNDNSNHSYSGTITSGTNQTLICSTHYYGNNNNYALAWNGDAFTLASTDYSYWGAKAVWYLNNPDVGAYTLTNSGTNTLNFVSCVVKENINQDDTVATSTPSLMTWVQGTSYNLQTSGNLVWLDSVSAYMDEVSTDWEDVYRASVVSQGPSSWHMGSYIVSTSSVATFTPSNWLIYQIVEFNINTELPPCTDYVYTDWTYCSNGYQTRQIESTVPSSCDMFNPESLAPDLGRECTPQTSIISPQFSYYGYLIPDTYNLFKYTYNKNVEIGEGDYITLKQCSSLACTGTTTTIIFDNGSATTTQLSITEPFGIASTSLVYGNSQFILPSPTDTIGTSTTQTLYYKITPYYQCALGSCVQGTPSSFAIKWNSEETAVQEGWWNIENIPTTTVLNLFGKTADEMACTEEEWEAAASSTSFFNFGALKCNSVSTFYTSINTISNVMRGAFDLLVGMVKNIFPFNVAYQIKTAWDNSATMNLPEDLSYIDIADSEGNLSLTIPAEWTGTGTSTSAVVFGKAAWDNTAMDSFFYAIRAFSVYIMGFWFFMRMFEIGKKLIKRGDQFEVDNHTD